MVQVYSMTSQGFCILNIDFLSQRKVCRQLMQSERSHFSMCTNIRAATPKLGATQNNLHTNYCFKDGILHCECRGGLSLEFNQDCSAASTK